MVLDAAKIKSICIVIFFFNFFYVTLHLGYENLEKCSIKRNVSSRLMKNVSTAASGNLSAKG